MPAIFIGIILFIAAILALYRGEELLADIVNLFDYLFGGLVDFLEHYYRALYNFIADNPWKLLIAGLIAVFGTLWIVRRQSSSRYPNSNFSTRVNRKRMAIILAILIGWLGAHRFYLRQAGYGVLYLVCTIIFAPFTVIVSLIDAFRFGLMSEVEFDKKYPAH
ncbi:TM2 domain-containing protein [Taylorella equigenitalis]|uniref:TM2 domain-containing protein n=1 Tax=Taylorella equigenitalis TaxID=29575 RepID=UPI00042A0F15|nr:NINE protein [Taylorella equigenitalis]WDU48530.1 NINE protein [Taylorella equigenitalis]WDU52519.1 NINE protein [Taylorella equigenitalis]WDU55517.1 NINE protein [Taylorella equigenitalis]WEE01090.1 NINE protein [Taylorella equigenitalis]WEE02568.1 NINE protein [Taylorella equigenitalis]